MQMPSTFAGDNGWHLSYRERESKTQARAESFAGAPLSCLYYSFKQGC